MSRWPMLVLTVVLLADLRSTGLTGTVEQVWVDQPGPLAVRVVDDRTGPSFADVTHRGDQSIILEPVLDAYVQSGIVRDDVPGESELRLGTFDGTTVARSFLGWDTAALAGGTVHRAVLSLRAVHAWSCQPRGWQLWSTGPATRKTRWDNQPEWQRLIVETTLTRGYSDTCPDGPVEVDVTDLVRDWAADAPTAATTGLRAVDETDVFGWKKFASTRSDASPRIEVDYSQRSGT